MKKKGKLIALILCLVMVMSLAACSKKTETSVDVTPQPTEPVKEAEATPEPTVAVLPDVPADRRDGNTKRSSVNESNPIVIGADTFDGKFSPFFGTSVPDRNVYEQTQISLITNNELAEPVAGVEYATAAWDFEMSVNADQTKSTYKFWLKNGVQFSDGHVMSADDVLFSMYLILDPKYDGSSTMYSLAIDGLKAYQTQILDEAAADSKLAEFETVGAKKVDDALSGAGDAAVLEKVWSNVKQNLVADSDTLIAYQYVPSMLSMEGPEDFLTTAKESIILFYTSSNLGIDLISYKDGAYVFDPSTGLTADKMAEYKAEDYINASFEAVKANITPAEFDEIFGYTSVDDAKAFYIAEEKAAYLEANKGTVKNISGITKGKEICSDGVERETITVVISGVDPAAIWKFSLYVAPMHYYAGQARHDAANGVDNFGVDFSSTEFMMEVKEKNGLPMGAGPYKVTDANGSENPTSDGFYSNGICYLMANDYFLLGAPNIKYLRYKTIKSGSEMDAVLTGEVHFSEPSASPDKINQITSDAAYAHMDYVLVDNLGFGYIGLNANLIPNINERKALLSAMDPFLSLNKYPGGLAAIIHRPMSQVSWAYPEGAEAFYPFDETAAKSKEYFLAAGFTEQADGTLLTPDGKKPSYTFTLPSGTDDHPAGQTFLKTQEVLAKLGVEVIIDIDDTVLSKLQENVISVWAAAWQSVIDPDMFQIYYSDPKVNQAGSPKNYGLYYLFENGTEEEKAILVRLNELIMQGRESLNVDERKPVYAEALDKVMEIAIMLPTYQRKNMYAYNKDVVDSSSLVPAEQITPYKGPLAEIWNVSLVEK